MMARLVPQGRWRLALQIALLAVLAWQMLGLVSAGAQRNLAFDGGMNLEVSKSIANGVGPRARYDSGDLYPAGVQSKEPFFLVGAAVFKVAGVGPMQAQATNLLFLFLLVLLIVRVIAHASDVETGLLAAVLALAMPQLRQYGLNGYGEIATMCFGLASLAVIAWPGRLQPSGWARPFFAGVLAALAVATKVVGVVQLVAIAVVLALRVVAEADSRTMARSLLRAGLAFAAGVAAPLLLIEAWRWYWLGRDGYRAYWSFQLDSIRSQSGAAPRDSQVGPLQKVPLHFAVLVREFGRGTLATLGLLAVPLLATVVLWRAWVAQLAPRRWLIAGLVLVACAYIPWWLAIVPTNKAWVRYLYIALLALALLAAMAAMASARIAASRTQPARRVAYAVLAAAIAVLYAPFVSRSLTRLDFSPGEEVQAVEYAAKVIRSLPDRPVFGYGWYAAPVIQLYSDRAFKDLTDWPIGRLTDKPAYLVADRAALQVNPMDRVLRRYPHSQLMRDNMFAQVYVIDFAHPNDPFTGMDASGVLSHVDFTKGTQGEYPLVSGYEPYDPMGGRFTETDSEILLRYEGQPVFTFTAYAGLPRFYARPEPLRGRVVIEGCPSRPFGFEGPQWKTFRIALPCKPTPGTNVRVRILLDNVFHLPRLYDRQRGCLVREIGFVD
jgi:hypothetical protein